MSHQLRRCNRCPCGGGQYSVKEELRNSLSLRPVVHSPTLAMQSASGDEEPGCIPSGVNVTEALLLTETQQQLKKTPGGLPLSPAGQSFFMPASLKPALTNVRGRRSRSCRYGRPADRRGLPHMAHARNAASRPAWIYVHRTHAQSSAERAAEPVRARPERVFVAASKASLAASAILDASKIPS